MDVVFVRSEIIGGENDLPDGGQMNKLFLNNS